MKDNSPLFHGFLLFVFVLALGFLTMTSGAPKGGLLRPGLVEPTPYQIPKKAEPTIEASKTALPQSTGSSESAQAPASQPLEPQSESPAAGDWQ
jgi:hypothetical protein